jgi:hypothetical protein
MPGQTFAAARADLPGDIVEVAEEEAMTQTMPSWRIRIPIHHGHSVRTPSDYARDAIAAVLRDAPVRVRFTTIRLTKRPGSVAAQADVEVNGQVVHASASAVHPRDAVDLLAGELRERLEWLSARGR